MAIQAVRRETPVSMRFRDDDLAVIGRGAALLGLSRTEYVRRAALHDDQLAMLTEPVGCVSSHRSADFVDPIDRASTLTPTQQTARAGRNASPAHRKESLYADEALSQ